MTDPWECFGENDDESDSGDIDNNEEDKIQSEKRNHLIAQANSKKNDSNSNITNKNHGDTCNNISEIHLDPHGEDNIRLLSSLELWKHRPPIYIGPMVVVEEVNSYRGYIAKENIKPGTLLLVEKPIFKWPHEQIGSELGLSSIQAIFEHDNAQDIVHDMEVLYPTKIDVDFICRGNVNIKQELKKNEKVQIKDMIEIMQMQHSGGKELDKILKLAQIKMISSSTTPGLKRDENKNGIDEIDIMRMLLALRYNGFDSGLYLHFALFNHNDDANCIKFQPESIEKGTKGEVYSEVRTTKMVKKGEPLTLHYMNPREVSHASRRLHIWDQHRFDIGEDMNIHDSKIQELELVDGNFPSSSKDKQDRERMSYLMENAMDDLERLLNDMKSAFALLINMTMGDEAIEMFERCKALEMACDELKKAITTKTGNMKHILLIRCCRLHLDSSEVLIRFANHPPSISLTNQQQNEIMCRFVHTCHVLLPIQIQYLGEYHPDIGRTYYDFAMGINSLLTHSPKKLYDLGISYLSNFASCQRHEAKCRKEYHSIDSLYPRDVEQKVLSHQNNTK